MKKIFKCLFLITVCLLLVFSITACSMDSDSISDNGSSVEGVVDETVVIDNQANDKKVLVTENLRIEEENGKVKSIQDNIENKTTEVGGTILKKDTSSYSGGLYYSYLTVKVPTAKLEEFITAVKNIGNVVSQDTYERDLTEEFNKNKEKITEITTRIATYEALYDEGNVSDKLFILDKVDELNKELDALTDKNFPFTDDVSYTKVFISINGVEPEDTTPRTVFLILLGIVVVIVIVVNILKIKNRKKQSDNQNKSADNSNGDKNDFFNNDNN